ncbi:hypothetical protein M422DRAFT_257889 [Sphaerobolus stellatus SS14]|uniref:Uncharacterized protein n=1 Tax=Sphaerobolus stellatus (strain SS14) TaxID=990650 RepID=A0A0C9U8C0_SPHS4|nr:hypothetical protein M422DRAFT_257889 [Sphaerobolus stellatus SS14]
MFFLLPGETSRSESDNNASTNSASSHNHPHQHQHPTSNLRVLPFFTFPSSSSSPQHGACAPSSSSSPPPAATAPQTTTPQTHKLGVRGQDHPRSHPHIHHTRLHHHTKR